MNGQAELAGLPDEHLAVFSKRTAAIDDALEAKVDEFRFDNANGSFDIRRKADAKDAWYVTANAKPYDADILRKEYNSQNVTGGLKVSF